MEKIPMETEREIDHATGEEMHLDIQQNIIEILRKKMEVDLKLMRKLNKEIEIEQEKYLPRFDKKKKKNLMENEEEIRGKKKKKLKESAFFPPRPQSFLHPPRGSRCMCCKTVR